MIPRRTCVKALPLALLLALGSAISYYFVYTAISRRHAYGTIDSLLRNQRASSDCFDQLYDTKSRSPTARPTARQLSELDLDPTELPICKQLVAGGLSTAENSALKLYNLEKAARLKQEQDKSNKIGSESSNADDGLFSDLSEGFVSKNDFSNLAVSNQSCAAFRKSRRYLSNPLSPEEAHYPLAYSILIHKDVQMFERLLRSIYQPQNFYCIHVDQKASEEFKNAIASLIGCFDNVFHPKVQTKVYYLHYSRVEADLNCLKEMEDRNYSYKYVFNLCGQDYPLKTNWQMVRDLKGLNGHNEIESVDVEKVGKLGRILKGYDLNLNSETSHSGTLVRNESKDKPGNLNYAPSLGRETGLFAGSAYFLFTKEAVHFMLTDEKIIAFFEWMRDGWSPDEAIWATINRYSRLPGSYPAHVKYEFNEVHTRTRLVKWAGLDRPNPNDGFKGAKQVAMYETCHGQWLRGVCVYGAGDVKWLVDSRHWFGNKFDPKVDPIAIDCLDVYLRKTALSDALDQAGG